MRLRPFFAVLSAALLLDVPVQPATGAAVLGRLSAVGRAAVNRLPVATEATVFAGDSISTQPQSLVTVFLDGGDRVFVTEQSQARVDRVENHLTVELEQGKLGVASRGGNRLVVRANGVLVRAGASPDARYLVALDNHAVLVFSIRGGLEVLGSNRSFAVPSGKAMRFELARHAQAPAGAGAALGPGATILIAVAVAAAATAIAVRLALREEKSMSPFAP